MKFVNRIGKCLGGISIFLSSVISVSAIALPANAQQRTTLPAGECFVVVASRQFLYEVREFLDGLDNGFTDVRVFQSSNDWYAISVGQVPISASKQVISNLVSDNLVPQDSICSTGKSYTSEINIAEIQQQQNPRADNYRGDVTFLTNIDLIGRDLTPRGIRNTDLSDCLLFCSGDNECRSLTHDTRRDICYLKTHEDANNAAEKAGLVSILMSAKPLSEQDNEQFEYVERLKEIENALAGSSIPSSNNVDIEHSIENQIIKILSNRPHCYHVVTDGVPFTSIHRIDVFSDGTFCKARFQEVFGEKNKIDFDPMCERRPLKFVQQMYRNTGEKYWLGGWEINRAPGVWPQFIIDRELKTIRMVDGYHPFLQDNVHFSRECSYYEY